MCTHVHVHTQCTGTSGHMYVHMYTYMYAHTSRSKAFSRKQIHTDQFIKLWIFLKNIFISYSFGAYVLEITFTSYPYLHITHQLTWTQITDFKIMDEDYIMHYKVNDCEFPNIWYVRCLHLWIYIYGAPFATSFFLNKYVHYNSKAT